MRISDWSSDVCSSDLIQPLGRVRPGAGIEIGDSILFASYATLRSEAGGDRRVDQILAWLSEEFDGLILFDEAHAMGGVAGGEGRFGTTAGSQQGIEGVELQNRLDRKSTRLNSSH